jgi:hypothetical protein
VTYRDLALGEEKERFNCRDLKKFTSKEIIHTTKRVNWGAL